MRDFPMPLAEHRNILKAACSQLRLDGRKPLDHRNIRVYFTHNMSGSCQVRLGATLVMSTVSCEVAEPRSQRPSEGTFHLNLDLSPMASASFSGGKLDRMGANIQSLLEHCIRDSRCLDLESLCIVAGEKVFVIRLNVTVLNHEGNLLDCAVLSAVIALAHFRRPDVSVSGPTVRVYKESERDPVPLTLRHFPLTLSFALFAGGKVVMLDPNRKEEAVMDGMVVVAMNIHRELCGLQTIGGMILERDQVLRCVKIARQKIRGLTYVLQRSLANANAGVFLEDDPELVFDLSLMVESIQEEKHEQQRQEAGLSEGELSDASVTEPAPVQIPGLSLEPSENAEAQEIYSSAVVSWGVNIEEKETTAKVPDEKREAKRKKRKRKMKKLKETEMEMKEEPIVTLL